MKSKLTPFLTTAPPSDQCKYDGGYAGGPGVNVSQLADELFREPISGAWLCCYMLRRFGWPNSGSDDYKNLMSWTLTTPIKGLFLSVTPYLGRTESRVFDPKWIHNLHFAVRFTKDIGRKLDDMPGRWAFVERRQRAIMRWWKTKGIKLYCWGTGKEVGDTHELVSRYADAVARPGKKLPKRFQGCKWVWGLWRRDERIKFKGDFHKRTVEAGSGMIEWWLGDFIAKHHPEVKLPKMTAREKRMKNTFAPKAHIALKRTLLDLLRETYVRDINFNIFGGTEERLKVGYASKKHPVVSPGANYFAGAGNTPAYWYSKDAAKDRAEAAKKPALQTEE